MTIEAPQRMRPYDPVSISPVEFWAMTADEREKSFKTLRDERPAQFGTLRSRARCCPSKSTGCVGCNSP
jgi:hypothetical protein